ncbi:MAG: hypothetical protein PHD95_07150 [Candidatus ainarchaeum sp.]|nr:hypothetical protein [Candidatus ainarchaeum sp.]
MKPNSKPHRWITPENKYAIAQKLLEGTEGRHWSAARIAKQLGTNEAEIQRARHILRWSALRIAKRLNIGITTVRKMRLSLNAPLAPNPHSLAFIKRRIIELLKEGKNNFQIYKQINSEIRETWKRLDAVPKDKNGNPKKIRRISKDLVKKIRMEFLGMKPVKMRTAKRKLNKTAWQIAVRALNKALVPQESAMPSPNEKFFEQVRPRITELPPSQKRLAEFAEASLEEFRKANSDYGEAKRTQNTIEMNKAKARAENSLARFNLNIGTLRHLLGESG